MLTMRQQKRSDIVNQFMHIMHNTPYGIECRGVGESLETQAGVSRPAILGTLIRWCMQGSFRKWYAVTVKVVMQPQKLCFCVQAFHKLVVDATSARGPIRESNFYVVPRTNHYTIAAPADPAQEAYIRQFIQKTCAYAAAPQVCSLALCVT